MGNLYLVSTLNKDNKTFEFYSLEEFEDVFYIMKEKDSDSVILSIRYDTINPWFRFKKDISILNNSKEYWKDFILNKQDEIINYEMDLENFYEDNAGKIIKERYKEEEEY